MSSTTVIVGTNKALWKSYTRLTESPKAEDIRPRSILQHAFEDLSKCIGERTYAWISDQLRSMRQDLMVQGIRDDLTLRVYELHLELALQNNDLHSFHTCHAQLEDIYSVGLKGRYFSEREEKEALMEYYQGLIFRKHIKRFEVSIRENPLVISTATMLDLFSQKAWSKAFHMALKLPESWSSFLGPFLDQQRKLAITSFIIGFGMTFPVGFVHSVLGLKDLADAALFLRKHGIILTEDEQKVDVNKTRASLRKP